MSGELPKELGQLENLVTAYLNNNAFTGRLPDEITRASNLKYLNLNNNNLAGNLPDEIGDWESLLESLPWEITRSQGHFRLRSVR